MQRRTLFLIAALVTLALGCGNTAAADTDSNVWTAEIPAPLAGPYIIDPATLIELDAPGSDCAQGGPVNMQAGPLNFQCLVFLDPRSSMTPADLGSNPFTLRVFEQVRRTVLADLRSIPGHSEWGGDNALGLAAGFLDFAGARIELVGVINRMDRQFNRDEVPGRGGRLKCGEISALYRFGYEGNLPSSAMGEHHYKSRLPVTMNVVFPAIPWSGELTCREVAQRWLDYARGLQQGADPDVLRQQARLIVSSLKPDDIDRIELNMQGSRVSAGADRTDFGTLGTYIIRVFRWAPDPAGGRWKPTYLTNQIDRARLLGRRGDDNTCEENRGRRIDRRDLVAYLLSMEPPGRGPNAIGDIDNGLLNIPQPFLACRAISISPGGASRSGNQPFWNAASSSEQIITDREIANALRRYRERFPDSLGFIGTVDEFRTRLNDASCSGCHQTRAIAGFHFPGADRAGGSPVNAVYLPGSPQFSGDQLRRMEILTAIANGDTPDFRALAMSYAARPFNRFQALKPSADPAVPPDQRMQLVGGWGGTCLTEPAAGEVRKWGCAEGRVCQPVFKSANQPRIGVCANPSGKVQNGDALQFGTVASSGFVRDKYKRD